MGLNKSENGMSPKWQLHGEISSINQWIWHALHPISGNQLPLFFQDASALSPMVKRVSTETAERGAIEGSPEKWSQLLCGRDSKMMMSLHKCDDINE